jgi:hypothetical protein
VIAGERLPNRLFRQPKCQGTIEDHRAIALDVRELIRKHVFAATACASDRRKGAWSRSSLLTA